MLPNHSPYVIAEHYGTLARLFPGRIDLGLGRAPGTDQATLSALRRSMRAGDRFPEDVRELQDYLRPKAPGQQVVAVPAAGTEVPLYILGSSHFGAALAAELGLPYAFASHFAPDMLRSAVEIYRSRFRASAALAAPYLIVGVNAIAAPTDAEAKRWATTQQMSFARLLRGNPGLSLPPIDDIDTYWSPHEKVAAHRMLAQSYYGTPERVRDGLTQLAEQTGADELIVVSDVYEPEDRLRSFAAIAEAML